MSGAQQLAHTPPALCPSGPCAASRPGSVPTAFQMPPHFLRRTPVPLTPPHQVGDGWFEGAGMRTKQLRHEAAILWDGAGNHAACSQWEQQRHAHACTDLGADARAVAGMARSQGLLMRRRAQCSCVRPRLLAPPPSLTHAC